MQDKMYITITYPVCPKKYLKQGLKNHIINTAKSEVWNNLKQKPHKDFFDKHKFKLPDRNTLIFYKYE